MSCCATSSKSTDKSNTQSGAVAAFAMVDVPEQPIFITYGERDIQNGFHITEIKRSMVSSLDCGSNQEGWPETVVQLLDSDGPSEKRITARKFVSILKKANVDLSRAGLQGLVFEIAKPGESLQLHEFKGVHELEDRVVVLTRPREALCKPAMRLQQSGKTSASGCC